MDAITEIGLTLYADLFCARTDAYVKDSAFHVNEPITPAVLEQAIIERHAISGYMAVVADGTALTHVGAIDFDHTPDGAPEAVQKTLTQLGVPSMLARSRRGAHLWVVCDVGDGTHGSVSYGDVPAASVRAMLEHAVRLTDAKYLEGIEVFPKSSASTWGCGALRLPLMTHPKSKQRYPVFDVDGNRLTKLVDVVRAVSYVPWTKIIQLTNDAPVQYPRNLGGYRRQTGVIGPAAVGLLSLLGVEAQPGRNVRCPFHDDSHASMKVAPDDQRVWCKAPECVAYNGGRGLGTLALSKMIEKTRHG